MKALACRDQYRTGHLRREMSRRDKADVMTSAFLQLEHHLGEAFVRDLVLFLFLPGLRDLVILAIDAAKVAVAKKDIAGAFCSAKARLLAKMRRV